MNAAPPPVISWGDFYVTGGTLRPDAPSYVDRQADRELCAGLLQGEFCYVLTSRQMGKSSLMVRTVKRLREDGVAVAVLDLTAIGQNLTIEQWYDGLISRLGQQLDLEAELTKFWEAHTEFGPLQRWLTSIEEVVLREIQSPVVIFVDEIDIVRSLPFSTDEFFAAIREAYNRRAREPVFGRLAFGLLGVATPTDLIRDTRTTPFNIGRRIELNDFTEEEVAPLARGLGPDDVASRELLSRVLYWTGGHPYLTQRLCRALAETIRPPNGSEERVPPVIPTTDTVDTLAEKLFLSRQARDRDDNLIFVRERILRSEVDVAGLLYLYRSILNRERVADDETNPLVSVLRLAGITRGLNGILRVRNRIYAHVFDHNWIHTNMPEAEVRRQRGARRKGVALGLAIAVVLVLGYLLIWPVVANYRRARTAQSTATSVEAAYRPLTSYRDTFESTVEIGVGGVDVPIRGSGSLLYNRPGRYNLNLRSDFSTPETEVRVSSDGPITFTLAPSLRQFKVTENRPGEPQPFSIPAELAEQLGPILVLPVYRLLVDPGPGPGFLRDVHELTYTGMAELNGEKVRVLQWQHNAAPLLHTLGLTNALERERVPVTAWVDSADHFVLQIRLDLSKWAKQLVGNPPDVNVTRLVLTEGHKGIETSIMPAKPTRFHLLPPPGSFPVDRFTVPERRVTTLASLRNQFTRTIPPRFANTPSNLVDLTEYYNAPLGKPWHPGGQSLEVLPSGVLLFGNVFFDVRGLVQLEGKRLEQAGGHYPRSVTGIRVEQTCRQLHFLHASGWRSRDGTLLGHYVVHYADGREQKIPIVYGEDVRDWSEQSDPSGTLKRATLVWKVLVPAAERGGEGNHVRLFKSTWVNPYPEVEITTMDYVSAMAEAAPFLVALTAEP